MKYAAHVSGRAAAQSPPSRGAWIEIVLDEMMQRIGLDVAPLAGGVD